METQPSRKRPLMVFLSEEEFASLSRICRARKQSRADFVRAAISVSDAVPNLNTRRLTGICLARQQERLAREKKATARRKAKRKD